MPLSATFTSCCGLGSASARHSRKTRIMQNTMLSPPNLSGAAMAPSTPRTTTTSSIQHQKFLALRLLLQGDHDTDDLVSMAPPASNCSISFGSSSFTSFASSNISPARAASQRLALLPVASSSPTKTGRQRTNDSPSFGSTFVYEQKALKSVDRSAIPKTKPPMQPGSMNTNQATSEAAKTKSKSKVSILSWSKRIVQAFQGNRTDASSSTPQPKTKNTSSKKTNSASRATGMKIVNNVMPQTEKRSSIVHSPLTFTPLSPESHILPQSPYQKAEAGQVRSFYKSKSTAGFRDLRPAQHILPPSNYFMLNSSGSSESNSSMSPMRHDPVTYLYGCDQGISPNQPAMIMRDWSSCAQAAAAASRRRPVTMSSAGLPKAKDVMTNSVGANLLNLMRSYNVPNCWNLCQRLSQFANINTVERLAKLAMEDPNQIRRIIRKVATSNAEQSRLADLIFDLVHVSGGQVPLRPDRSVRSVTNSSTDSGVYNSDGDNQQADDGSAASNAYMLALGEYVERNQIELAGMPFSDKFGFGHIDADWVISLAGVLRADAATCATCLEKLRLEALRKVGRIGIPQKELIDKVRSAAGPNDGTGMRSLGRNLRNSRANQKSMAQLRNGCASLNRNFASKTVSQPMLLNSHCFQVASSQDNATENFHSVRL